MDSNCLGCIWYEEWDEVWDGMRPACENKDISESEYVNHFVDRKPNCPHYEHTANSN